MPNANADIPTNGLIGYWTGNGNANDSSNIGNNGSYAGSYVEGRNGNQAFDLSTEKVTIPNNPVYSNIWAVSFDFNLNGTDPSGAVFIGQDEGGGYQNKWFIAYGYTTTDTFQLHLNGPSIGSAYFINSDSVLLDGGWNQLTVAGNYGIVSFYLNGANIGSDTYTESFPETTAPLIFGQAENLTPYSGLISNVALYNRALTSSDVQWLSTGVNPVPLPSALPLFATALIGFCAFRKKMHQA